MKKNTRLTIIAHLPHSLENSKWFSYEPYVREIEIWAEIFNEIEIYTDVPSKKHNWQVKQLPDNCIVKKVFMKSGPGFYSNLLRLFQFPFVFIHIWYIMYNAKILHLRSHGVTTIIANFLNKFLNKKTIVKWATSFSYLPLKSKILKWEYELLLSPPTNTKVLIYANSVSVNHISFFPALFSKIELDNFSLKVNYGKWKVKDKIEFVFVGRLTELKNLGFMIDGFSRIDKSLNWNLTIVGNGPLLNSLKTQVNKLLLFDRICFVGNKTMEETMDYLGNAHFSIIPGIYEGWSKVINESWACETIPVCIDAGNTPYPIKRNARGGILFNNDINNFTETLESLFMLKDSEIEGLIGEGHLENDGVTLESFAIKLEKVIESLNVN
jgi:glycosyltransferase involved in cell wall biosynthesis